MYWKILVSSFSEYSIIMPVAQLTKSRSLNLAKLNSYTADTSTATALHSRVKELYKNSTIKHLKTAETLFSIYRKKKSSQVYLKEF